MSSVFDLPLFGSVGVEAASGVFSEHYFFLYLLSLSINFACNLLYCPVIYLFLSFISFLYFNVVYEVIWHGYLIVTPETSNTLLHTPFDRSR